MNDALIGRHRDKVPIGQIRASRNDCASALCVSATCQQCTAGQCGFEAHRATTCACRTTDAGEKVCTGANCRFFLRYWALVSLVG